MPLFDPGEHEPLTQSRWDDRRVRVAIERIVGQALEAFEPGRFWPRSPLDATRW
jgi:hypothetical protein